MPDFVGSENSGIPRLQPQLLSDAPNNQNRGKPRYGYSDGYTETRPIVKTEETPDTIIPLVIYSQAFPIAKIEETEIRG